MKFLIFSPYYPPHIGGLESHADEFNKYLAQEGNTLTVFTPHIPISSPSEEIFYKTVRVLRFPAIEIIPNFPLPKFWSLKFWQMFRELFKQDFDLIISRTRFFLTSLLALIYAKLKKVKWIHIEHGSDFVQLSSRFKSLVAKFYDYTLGWLVFKCSDLNISISEAVQSFVYKFDKRKSPIIYRGLNTDELDLITPNDILRKKYLNKTILAFVGRLYKWKGVKNSIQAVMDLPPELKSKIIFIIVGDGEDLTELKQLAINDTSIFFTGNLPRKKAVSILKTSAVYLHSAYPGGGLSTSLLEAMYCNNAIIATPNEGAKEIIKNGANGLLIKKSSPEEITRAIKRLMLDEIVREEMAQSANKTIVKKINWGDSIKKYEKEINKLLDNK